MNPPSFPTLSSRFLEIPSSAPVRLADLATSLRAEGRSLCDFSAGRAAEATPAYICSAAKHALDTGDTHQSMAQGSLAYRRACARKLARDNGIQADPNRNLIATLGCKQGLMLTLMALLDYGDEVIIEDPCFVSYQPEIRFCGGIPVAVPMRAEADFRWTAEDLAKAITPRTKAILFCNPHNPTGNVLTRSDLEIIAAFAQEHDLMVIADEIYERMPWGGRRHVSIATLPGMAERTITLMGTTKGFCMGGWRIGFACGPEPVVRGMVVVQQHMQTSVSSFAQAGAAVAFGEPPSAELLDIWRDWERRTQHVAAEINRIPGVKCKVPEGGFYAWIDVRSKGASSEVIAEKLLRDHNVVLVPGAAFGPTGEGFLRMTCVKSWQELHAGLAEIARGLS